MDRVLEPGEALRRRRAQRILEHPILGRLPRAVPQVVGVRRLSA
ncbi:MAG: hypothetical protein AAGC60_17360 [Acidobacteriota bacterium]